AYLEHEGLWGCVTGTDTDQGKMVKTKSKLILLIKPINFSHIQHCTTPKQVWDVLKRTFDDNGLMRRVNLIRIMATTKLSDCVNMEAYVNLIMSTAHQLTDIGVILNDEWIGTFMLSGLPESYGPMIMALENSATVISSDAIKTKLLQEFTPSEQSNSSKAFSTFKKQASRKKGGKNWTTKSSEPSVGKSDIQCFACQQYGHKAFECPKKKKNTNETSSHVKVTKKGAFVVCPLGTSNDDDWFIDSASSYHMTSREDWLLNTTDGPIDQILAANNSTMKVQSAGEVLVDIDRDGFKSHQVSISNVLHVKELSSNLLSVSQLCKKGHKVIFTNEGCQIFDNDSDLVATGRHVHNMYVLNLSPHRCLFTSTNKQSLLWRQRLGHLNLQDLSKLKSVANGIDFATPKKDKIEFGTADTLTTVRSIRSGMTSNELVSSFLLMLVSFISLGKSKPFVTERPSRGGG
ncbi:Retrovirus-related Pol polyprotein from transposon TNT 1-94, partial [Pseudolycoriella hygida]